MANPCVIRPEAARSRLLALGWTQTALAERCNLELRTLQRWLAGGRTSLADAERVADVLGVGTSEIFDGVPDELSPFGLLRGMLRVLGLREGALSQAIRLTLDQFDFIERHVSLNAHPRRGFVQRASMTGEEPHRFAVFRLTPLETGPTRLSFAIQSGRRFRYEFGEVVVDGEARLVEHFHTRSMRAPLADDRSFVVWSWIPREMRDLVIVGDRDFRLTREASAGGQLFDLGASETRHALCFRPSSMHLRVAGLPPAFDRVVGDRAGRVDQGSTTTE